jgi:hypothetical protein
LVFKIQLKAAIWTQRAKPIAVAGNDKRAYDAREGVWFFTTIRVFAKSTKNGAPKSAHYFRRSYQDGKIVERLVLMGLGGKKGRARQAQKVLQNLTDELFLPLKTGIEL